ncbi:MAG TPA: hypothetical protein GXZ39_01695 [Bacteroidales bacterium]|jgi:hypothetical protein|nr:hypothetical protein [Bacteroidales bacterium]
MFWKRIKNSKEFESGNEVLQDLKGYSLKDLVSGKVFTRTSFTAQGPYFLFLVLLAFIYINNHYALEKLLKRQVALNKEVQELQYEAITTSSELMQMSRQSEVIRRVEAAGLELEVLKTPPRIIKAD